MPTNTIVDAPTGESESRIRKSLSDLAQSISGQSDLETRNIGRVNLRSRRSELNLQGTPECPRGQTKAALWDLELLRW